MFIGVSSKKKEGGTFIHKTKRENMEIKTNTISFKARVTLESDKPTIKKPFNGISAPAKGAIEAAKSPKATFINYLRKHFLYPKFNIKIKMPS